MKTTRACPIPKTTHAHLTVEVPVRLWRSCLHRLFSEQLKDKHSNIFIRSSSHSSHMLSLVLFIDLHRTDRPLGKQNEFSQTYRDQCRDCIPRHSNVGKTPEGGSYRENTRIKLTMTAPFFYYIRNES